MVYFEGGRGWTVNLVRCAGREQEMVAGPRSVGEAVVCERPVLGGGGGGGGGGGRGGR